MVTTRESLHKAIDDLSTNSLQELEQFIAYLRFKEQTGETWIKSLYDLYAPVRDAAADMSEDEINALIDEAIQG